MVSPEISTDCCLPVRLQTYPVVFRRGGVSRRLVIDDTRIAPSVRKSFRRIVCEFLRLTAQW